MIYRNMIMIDYYTKLEKIFHPLWSIPYRPAEKDTKRERPCWDLV